MSFFALTEFRGENSVSSSQPSICVPKRTHRVCRRTHRVCPKTQWGSVSSLLGNSTLETVFRRFLIIFQKSFACDATPKRHLVAHEMKNPFGFSVFHCVEVSFGASSGGTPIMKNGAPRDEKNGRGRGWAVHYIGPQLVYHWGQNHSSFFSSRELFAAAIFTGNSTAQFRRPLKTTFDMTTLIFSTGGCHSYPFYSFKRGPWYPVFRENPSREVATKDHSSSNPLKGNPLDLKTKVDVNKVDVKGFPNNIPGGINYCNVRIGAVLPCKPRILRL